MASAFAEAIMSSVVQSMDPTVAMQRDAIQGYVENQKSTVLTAKATAVAEIGQLLQKSIDADADTTIITAYQKLLAQLTS